MMRLHLAPLLKGNNLILVRVWALRSVLCGFITPASSYGLLAGVLVL